jgi:hypothetical protein
MTEPKPTYNTDPTAPEHQIAAHWYLIMQQAHEVGLMAQRQLEQLNALPDNQRLFTTRKERRGMPD